MPIWSRYFFSTVSWTATRSVFARRCPTHRATPRRRRRAAAEAHAALNASETDRHEHEKEPAAEGADDADFDGSNLIDFSKDEDGLDFDDSALQLSRGSGGSGRSSGGSRGKDDGQESRG